MPVNDIIKIIETVAMNVAILMVIFFVCRVIAKWFSE